MSSQDPHCGKLLSERQISDTRWSFRRFLPRKKERERERGTGVGGGGWGAADFIYGQAGRHTHKQRDDS